MSTNVPNQPSKKLKSVTKKIDDLEAQTERLALRWKVRGAILEHEATSAAKQSTQSKQKRAEQAEAEKEAKEVEEAASTVQEIKSQLAQLKTILDDPVEAEELVDAIESEASSFFEALEALEFKSLMRLGAIEKQNCYIDLHPGAGGSDSEDWTMMLAKMYQTWAENRNLSVKTIEWNRTDAGLKHCCLHVRGDFSYGLLRTESGVHRLVRISPFRKADARHTSFCTVKVYPSLAEQAAAEDQIKMPEIHPSEIELQTFRASGPGGQGVNTVDSAVRITHIPSGIVVSCQDERSQHENKAQAIKVLRARLFQMLLEKANDEKQNRRLQSANQSWGKQIRNYVLHPYKLVSDVRSRHSTSNPDRLLEDGDLDEFIFKSLEWDLFEFASSISPDLCLPLKSQPLSETADTE